MVRIVKPPNRGLHWELIGTADDEEKGKKRREYDANPVVQTIRHFVAKADPIQGWMINMSDFAIASGEIFNECRVEVNPQKLGIIVNALRTDLYFYDGIGVEDARIGRERRTRFFLKKNRPYQSRFIMDEPS
jgi:hypothetical protein